MNAENAFVLGVDLDGVCGDYETALRHVVAAECGVAPDSFGPQTEWEFSNGDWPIRDLEHYVALHKTGVLDYRMFASMPVIDGASDALWRLSDAGVWIRVITHRLFVSWGHAIVVGDTVDWLQQTRPDGRPLIPYRDICFVGQKADVGSDLYVDDAPHNIAALRKARADVITYDTLYNRDVPGLRAHSWDEVADIVLQRVADRGQLAEPD